ncbi:hypothetical protein T265_08167 [Opisthorchis viverrini]|uniref:Uncharacterized protein n=1 Tax=Opisthorchis viverrini TaxID=6198 RepID=A0A074ZEI4_OPIVI|nr:hypothetical protein T265_08167 [Opisthorchis viverrini]KER24077.1 hypothetical protein T265_08167 [Opisthorchis viverrini]
MPCGGTTESGGRLVCGEDGGGGLTTVKKNKINTPAQTVGSNRSTVTPFRCLTAMPPEGSARTRILPGSPSLDMGSRVAEVGFESRTFRSVNSRYNYRAIRKWSNSFPN